MLLLIGIVTSGSSLGGVILPIMTQKLIEDFGFGWSMRITALFMLYLLTIANFTITSRMPPRPKPFVVTAFLDPLKEVPFALVTFGAFLFTLGFFIPFNFVIGKMSRTQRRNLCCRKLTTNTQSRQCTTA